jgi:hypothetical protein
MLLERCEMREDDEPRNEKEPMSVRRDLNGPRSRGGFRSARARGGPLCSFRTDRAPFIRALRATDRPWAALGRPLVPLFGSPHRW